MSLPSVLKIGPYDVKIVDIQETAAAKGDLGRWSPADLTIGLCDDYATPQLEADTLLHEILHALWSNSLLPQKHEERIVTVLATGLTQVLRDNPDLRMYLNSALGN